MATRLTKKGLREVMSSLGRRIKELRGMNEEQLLAEMQRCFPGMEVSGGKPIEYLGYLVADAIDRAVPVTWVD